VVCLTAPLATPLIADSRRSSPSMKRLLDVGIAVGALIVFSPILLVAAIGIKLTSSGPILYRAQRIASDRRRSHSDRRSKLRDPERRRRDGYWGREFTMYKFRTMRVTANDAANPVAGPNDSRVFPFGRFLRATKIDELPQLFNVLTGEMTLVGPRPEAPEIVRSHYTQDDLTTLQVPPGITSPGTVYYYTHCETRLAAEGVVEQYVEELLPTKLALDRIYLRRATVRYDIRVILRTLVGILARILGVKSFPEPPELRELDLLRTPLTVDAHSYRDHSRPLPQDE
jgi:lipopolysaccharide/colanic/teichoic acid biosynthesis glycosyltransferase